MVAFKSYRCPNIKIAVVATVTSRISRYRGWDLVPWADPYITKLIRKLQAEVRSERAAAAAKPCQAPAARNGDESDYRRNVLRNRWSEMR